MSDRWPALLSRKEAAEYLGVSPAQVSLMKASQQIRSVKFGTKILYRRSELDELIESLEYGDGYCAAAELKLAQDNAARKAKRAQKQASRSVPESEPQTAGAEA